MGYNRVTKRFKYSSNNSSLMEFTKLCAAIPSFWEENKNYHLPVI